MNTKEMELNLACEKLAYALKLGKVLPTADTIKAQWKAMAKKSSRK